jgi:hypothetical protein
MNEVIAANGKSITVPTRRNDGQVGTRRFQASRNAQRSTMCRMKTIGIHEERQPTRTSDPSNDRHVLLETSETCECFVECG